MHRLRRLDPVLATLLALWLCLAQVNGQAHPLSHLAVHEASAGIDDVAQDGPRHVGDVLCLDCVAAASSAQLLATALRQLPVAARALARPASTRHGTPSRPRERQRNRSPPRL
ncbi:MAG: hypothetical protein HYS20_01365 [Rhodocyclales bacterium]|nr:hypothetical protein [Rhodocyclales bacterium]